MANREYSDFAMKRGASREKERLEKKETWQSKMEPAKKKDHAQNHLLF